MKYIVNSKTILGGVQYEVTVPVYEDKLVQQALKKVLEAVFEPRFRDCMFGFRPGRSCHDALRRLNSIIERGKTSYVLDANIEGFFNHIDHEWLIKFVEIRVKDPNIIRLIRKLLKAGIIENGEYRDTDEGSEQGSGCSPILAYICTMHYVLVLWFYKVAKPQFKGYSDIVIYADDFVYCFRYKSEAEQFYKMLKERFGKFGLKLEESKSRLIKFGRFAESSRKIRGDGKPETFDFLGFTHYCSKSRKGNSRVKRKTSKKKFKAKLKLFTEWVNFPISRSIFYTFSRFHRGKGRCGLPYSHLSCTAAAPHRRLLLLLPPP